LKKYKNGSIKGRKGNVKITFDTEGKTETRDITAKEVFDLIMSQVKITTLNDSLQGIRILDALDEATKTGYIEIEEGCHDWLKPKLTFTGKDGEKANLCSAIFRYDGNEINDFILEGYEKPKQSKEE